MTFGWVINEYQTIKLNLISNWWDLFGPVKYNFVHKNVTIWSTSQRWDNRVLTSRRYTRSLGVVYPKVGVNSNSPFSLHWILKLSRFLQRTVLVQFKWISNILLCSCISFILIVSENEIFMWYQYQYPLWQSDQVQVRSRSRVWPCVTSVMDRTISVTKKPSL